MYLSARKHPSIHLSYVGAEKWKKEENTNSHWKHEKTKKKIKTHRCYTSYIIRAYNIINKIKIPWNYLFNKQIINHHNQARREHKHICYIVGAGARRRHCHMSICRLGMAFLMWVMCVSPSNRWRRKCWGGKISHGFSLLIAGRENKYQRCDEDDCSAYMRMMMMMMMACRHIGSIWRIW